MTDEPCIYRALVTIALPDRIAEPGTLLSEGQNIPVGWVPCAGDVDPLTDSAVRKYYEAGPKPPPAVRSIQPKVFWQVTQHASHREWTLVGSNLPTINCI
jgi:hypothetical protein